MRNFIESIAVCLTALSFVTLPLGLLVFLGGINGTLVDAEHELNLWVVLTSLSVCLIPPLGSFALYRISRGR